ncbi:MAG: acyloxyacyl hydrolase [Planctomycetota bacterium]
MLTIVLPAVLATSPVVAGVPVDLDLEANAALDFRFEPVATVSPGALQDDEVPRVTAAPLPFGVEGSRRWSIQGGYGDNLDDSEFGQAGVGIEWFFRDNLSFNLDLLGFATSQPGDNGAGASLNLLFRWYFMEWETWSLFVDGGAGFLLTNDDVPTNGTSYNFTPQAGVGVSFDCFTDARGMVGVRWHHISNANIDDENPGRDSVYVWGGLSFPF